MASDQFERAANLSTMLSAHCYQLLTDEMTEFGTGSPLRQAAFMTQIRTESSGFSQLSESSNYPIAGLAIFGNRLIDELCATVGWQPRKNDTG